VAKENNAGLEKN